MSYYRQGREGVGAPYMPTPQDIRRECRKIQRGWSKREEQGRCAEADRCIHALIPLVSIREFNLGMQRLIESENKLH